MVTFGLWVAAATFAHGSVSLLLEQPYGGMGAVNPTGHSAIYLDHVCAETPLKLRVCRPGEMGAVISRYDDIDGYDWVAIPLLPYLYAVESAEEIPQSVDAETVTRMRDSYRRAHLESVAADVGGGVPPAGNWYELVGSSYDRTIYAFQVKSTAEQDARLIALLNDRANVQRYNGAFRNCADFTRVTLNRFYPHAVRRNFIADLGLTTPKSVARALTHYASKHPEAGLQVFVIPQVKGSLPRSHHAQGVAESLLTRYVVPLTLISPVLTGVAVVAYVGHGRFDPARNAAVLDLTETSASQQSLELNRELTDPLPELSPLQTSPLGGPAALLPAMPATDSAVESGQKGAGDAVEATSPFAEISTAHAGGGVPRVLLSAPALYQPLFQ